MFRKTARYGNKWNILGKIGFYYFGYPFIGGFIKSQYFKTLIKKIKFSQVLDAGCGSGEYSFFLASKFPLVKIDAFDIDPKNIDFCQNLNQTIFKFPNINFECADLNRLNKKDGYDLIFSIDVLEHIPSNMEVIKKFYGALKKDGYLIIHIPSKNWYEINLFPKQNFQQHDAFVKKHHPGAIFDFKEFIAFLTELGFKMVLAKKTFGYPGKIAWETDKMLQENHFFRLRMVLIPFLKMVAFFDKYIYNKRGGCILVLAQK